MIKIKIFDIEKHRNETTFRPYLWCKEYFNRIGIDFVFHGDDYDLAWVGQASFSDKSLPLSESINRGCEYIDKIKKPIWLFDGQDSASVVGTYDVFLNSKARKMFKNTMYRNLVDYLKPSINGRNFWPCESIEHGSYYVQDTSKLTDVHLSGTNWLSTIRPSFGDRAIVKDIDVFALFAYPTKQNFEFNIETSIQYNEYRKKWLLKLKEVCDFHNFKIITLPTDGNKYPIDKYYEYMSRSNIVFAPFGYGEIAPRDIEATQFGCVLMKPDMSHLKSIPWIYDNENYVSLKWDRSDLEDKLLEVLSSDLKRNEIRCNMMNSYIDNYTSSTIILHIHKHLIMEDWICESK